MEIVIKRIASISNKFRKLIQSGNYEKLLLEILNSSTKLFPNELKHNEDQSCGQCDFVDIVTNEKYDAKLPFVPEQGKLIGSNNYDFGKWLETMIEEASEFGEYINTRGSINLESLTLYKLMNKIIISVKYDENIIFLFPYPIVDDGINMIHTQFATDLLSAVFHKLKENNMVGDRKVYAIYPGIDQELVLRCLNTDVREYLKNTQLREYIDYEAVVEID